MVSAAQHVEAVDQDPVVIFDGLTKNWRYPGWRTTWIVAPQQVIEAVSSSGSFLDGGGSKPLQRSAVPLLDPAIVRAETAAIRHAFLRSARSWARAPRRRRASTNRRTSTCGATSRRCRRRSTTAWASSGRRWSGR
jgi:aspartate/methionine/tyrosine aminotransferase